MMPYYTDQVPISHFDENSHPISALPLEPAIDLSLANASALETQGQGTTAREVSHLVCRRTFSPFI